jgi:hypothetical protein
MDCEATMSTCRSCQRCSRRWLYANPNSVSIMRRMNTNIWDCLHITFQAQMQLREYVFWTHTQHTASCTFECSRKPAFSIHGALSSRLNFLYCIRFLLSFPVHCSLVTNLPPSSFTVLACFRSVQSRYQGAFVCVCLCVRVCVRIYIYVYIYICGIC